MFKLMDLQAITAISSSSSSSSMGTTICDIKQFELNRHHCTGRDIYRLRLILYFFSNITTQLDHVVVMGHLLLLRRDTTERPDGWPGRAQLHLVGGRAAK